MASRGADTPIIYVCSTRMLTFFPSCVMAVFAVLLGEATGTIT
jgi:hypothetical protein